MIVVLERPQVTRAGRIDSDRGIVPALHVAIRVLLVAAVLGALVVLRVPVAPRLRSDQSSNSIHPSVTGHTGQGRKWLLGTYFWNAAHALLETLPLTWQSQLKQPTPLESLRNLQPWPYAAR